jgi:hypothetical protein
MKSSRLKKSPKLAVSDLVCLSAGKSWREGGGALYGADCNFVCVTVLLCESVYNKQYNSYKHPPLNEKPLSHPMFLFF